jgi:superfamily I DNA and/or RNA helicase
MPQPIAKIISDISYGGKLKTHPSKNMEVEKCLFWFDVIGEDAISGSSRVNHEEATDILHLIDSFDDDDLDRCIIVMLYKSQAALIAGKLREMDILVPVVTTDRFQGREDGIIILSLVCTSTAGFASDKKRANVALSHAKEKLYVVGKKEFWRE